MAAEERGAAAAGSSPSSEGSVIATEVIVHLSQKMRPHERQWCLPRAKLRVRQWCLLRAKLRASVSGELPLSLTLTLTKGGRGASGSSACCH